MAFQYPQFTVLGNPSSRNFTPRVNMESTLAEYIFRPEECKFDTDIILSFDPSTGDLTFRMKWNNSGAKWYTEDQAFNLQFTPTANDIIVEGYRTKTIRLKRPVVDENAFFL